MPTQSIPNQTVCANPQRDHVGLTTPHKHVTPACVCLVSHTCATKAPHAGHPNNHTTLGIFCNRNTTNQSYPVRRAASYNPYCPISRRNHPHSSNNACIKDTFKMTTLTVCKAVMNEYTKYKVGLSDNSNIVFAFKQRTLWSLNTVPRLGSNKQV